jgi:predicted DNA binding protein
MSASNSQGSTTKVIIEIPSKLWISDISKQYPESTFEIISAMPISFNQPVGNNMVKIINPNALEILEKIKNHPSIESVSIIEQTPTSIVINTQTKDKEMLEALIKSKVIIHFPIFIKDGKGEFVLSGLRISIDKFFEILDSKSIKCEIRSLGKYIQDRTIMELTPRQLEIYYKAQQEGYYDVPRRITLTELAEKLNIAKSTLSSILQRIHNKLIG